MTTIDGLKHYMSVYSRYQFRLSGYDFVVLWEKDSDHYLNKWISADKNILTFLFLLSN